MFVVPTVRPVTTPIVVTTVPTAVLLLLHVPPELVLASVVVRPVHTVAEPIIAGGSGATVTTTVRLQPVANE